jgi:hypothetical protein
VSDAKKRADSVELVKLFSSQTGFEPKMWGPAIIGFGRYHYKYASGREGDMPIAAFSPRKQDITFYFETEFENRDALLAKLGKCKTGKCCVYIKKIDDIDPEILKKMIDASIAKTRSIYP